MENFTFLLGLSCRCLNEIMVVILLNVAYLFQFVLPLGHTSCYAWLFTLPTTLQHQRHCKAEERASIEMKKNHEDKRCICSNDSDRQRWYGRNRERETHSTKDMIGVVKEL